MKRDPHALTAFLDSRADWRFGYGRGDRTHDCVRFAAAGVEAVTGYPALSRVAHSWTTARGARRVLARLGGMAAAVDRVMRPIPVTMAARGDVGMTATGQLVLVEGDTVVGLSPERGLFRLTRAALASAWTTPEVDA